MKDASKIYGTVASKGKRKGSFAAACELGMEGIVGKKADSIYSGTRNGDWVKLKCDTRQEFVVGGYTFGEKNGGVSSLLLASMKGRSSSMPGGRQRAQRIDEKGS